jgi:hypothetical protein
MRFTPLIGPVGEMRAISTAAGGTALTSASTFLQLLPGAEAVQVVARNFATAVAVQAAFCPWLAVLKTTDSFATTANVTDYTEAAQDNNTSTTIVLSSLATSGALWVGSHVPFRGLNAVVGSTNSNTAALSGTYWNGTTMANISLTDGTATSSTAFSVSGNITWTLPTDWVGASLTTLASVGSSIGAPHKAEQWFWVRLVVSAALDSSVTLTSLLALNRSTAYHEIVADSPELAMQVQRGIGGQAALELKCDAGTANAVVNCLTAGKFV